MSLAPPVAPDPCLNAVNIGDFRRSRAYQPTEVDPLLCDDNLNESKQKLKFIHSFILETDIATLQETTAQRRSQPSHGHKRRTSERCKNLEGWALLGSSLS